MVRVVHREARAGYQRLLDSGVEVWCYQPTLLHAKTMTVDNKVALVGSVNLDLRSLTLNQQVGLIMEAPSVTATLDRHIDDDLMRCVRLRELDWRARGPGQRALEVAATVVNAPFRAIGGAGMTSRRP